MHKGREKGCRFFETANVSLADDFPLDTSWTHWLGCAAKRGTPSDTPETHVVLAALLDNDARSISQRIPHL
jgi:hypothetical protein